MSVHETTCKVQAMLEPDRVVIDCRVSVTPDEAKTFVADATAYNNFTSAGLFHLVCAVTERIPRMDHEYRFWWD
jgi:hypothetical protein